MKSTTLAALAATTAALGCRGHAADADSDVSPGLTVMTQNVYLGADIDPILNATTEREVPVAVTAAWKQLEVNRFEDRADAIASIIARAQPQVVALQEVALFRRFPHDGSPHEEIDFLAVLQRALAARGLSYSPAVVQHDSDVHVPMLAGFDGSGAPLLDGVQMIDRDVVLARAGVAVSRPESARYRAALQLSFADASVEIVRGWASVIVQTEAGSFRFITTHLEDHAREIQAAQAAELLAIASAEPLPIVLAGDFNSPADGSGTPTYGSVAAAGFQDVWTASNPDSAGFTCGRAADLRLLSPLTERLDIVFARGLAGTVHAALVGDSERDRASSGLWPSDHAGVVATFRTFRTARTGARGAP